MPISIVRDTGQITISTDKRVAVVAPKTDVQVVRPGAQGPQGEIGPQGVQGPAGSLTKPVADVRYEAKSALLQEAAWHVDAGAVTVDGLALEDLTGKGRPAVFGTTTAKPVVMPWSGEDYITCQNVVGNLVGMLGKIDNGTRSTARVMLSSRATDTIFWGTNGANTQQVDVWATAAGLLNARYWNGSAEVGVTAAFTLTATPFVVHDVVMDLAADGTTITLTLDGVAQTRTWVTSRPAPTSTASLYAVYTSTERMYLTSLSNGAYICDPRNVSADYTTIANTGTLGGTWAIGRAATGLKVTVVDRPLLLFGGAQIASAAMPKITQGTVVHAWRTFADTSAAQMIMGKMSGTAGADGLYTYQGPSSASIWAGTYIGGLSDTAVMGSLQYGQHVYAHRLSATEFASFYDGTKLAADTALSPGALLISDGVRLGRASSGGSTYGAGELIAAAIFDRALTDAEIAQVSQELAGTPHAKQPDPHPQYDMRGWTTVATWSALPVTGNWAGRRVRVTSGLGLLVALWDGAAWRVDQSSDTGWYTIALNTPALFQTHARNQLRRIGDICYWALSLTAGTGTIVGTRTGITKSMPGGWRPLTNDYTATAAPAVRYSDYAVLPVGHLSSWANLDIMTPASAVVWGAGHILVSDGISWITADPWPTSAPT